MHELLLIQSTLWQAETHVSKESPVAEATNWKVGLAGCLAWTSYLSEAG